MKKKDNNANQAAMGGKTREDRRMKIFHSEELIGKRVEQDGFALDLLNLTMPDWLHKGLRKDMVNSLRGFTEDVALVIADNLIDCWTGLGLHLTGIYHIDAMLWNFYWRILDCARRKGITLAYWKAEE